MRAPAALLLLLLAGPARAAGPPEECVEALAGAMYNSATTRYGHAVMGARSEWAMLSVFLRLGLPCRAGGSGTQVVLPPDMVFEGDGPLIADLDGDGEPEVATVESQAEQGSRIAIYRRAGAGAVRIASTRYIGTRHRWIALAAVGDLDGDGLPELAAVDRPHLARVLRLYQLRGTSLVEVAAEPGFTNHRFGEPAILGGLRDCDRPELVLATADWKQLVAVRWDGRAVTARQIGLDTSPAAFEAAMACR